MNWGNCTLGLMGCRMDGREPIRVKRLYIGVNGLQDGWPGSHSGKKLYFGVNGLQNGWPGIHSGEKAVHQG